MPPGVLCPRFLQVALCPVGAAELEMTAGLVRGELLGLLHVLDRLREIAGLPEYVEVPERGVRREHTRRKRQGFPDRCPSRFIAVQRALDSSEGEPGAGACGVLLHQPLAERQLTGQVV